MRVVIVKFVAERVLALERKKETVFLFDFFGSEFDGKFEFLELDDHVVFLCPGADFVHHVERIENIDDEDSEVNTYKERVNFVKIYPVDEIYQHRVNEDIIRRADNAPEKREQRTNYALNIARAFGVIPKFNFKPNDEDKTGYIFDKRHNHGYEQNHEHLLQNLVLNKTVVQRTNYIKENHAGAVQGQARTRKKSRVNPFFMRESAEKKFYDPAASSAYDKQQA